jgi:hypothetical protein
VDECQPLALGMKLQEVSNALHAYPSLGLMPGAEARAALEAAVVRVGPSMSPRVLSTTIWSYATLGLIPGWRASEALEAAVGRCKLAVSKPVSKAPMVPALEATT